MIRERNKKPTLEQVRTLFPFDVPTLAVQAGVATNTLYSALLLHPISQQDAERILRAVSQHCGLALSLDNVDIVTWKEFLFLWLIRASADEHTLEGTKDRYTFVYAKDQDHAASLAQQWFEQLPAFPHHVITICEDGFQIGDIEVPGYQHNEEDVRQEV